MSEKKNSAEKPPPKRTAESANGAPPAPPKQPLPWEMEDLVAAGRLVFGEEWEKWLDTPVIWLDWKRPRDLIGTDREYWLRGIIHGRIIGGGT